MYIEKRDVGVNVLLSIVTCGIYFWVWYYKIASDIYRLSGEEDKAGVDLLLSLITCGIYFIYSIYKFAKKLSVLRTKYGMPYKDESSMYLILTVLGYLIGITNIIAICLLQSNLNDEFTNPPMYGQSGQNGQY